MNEIEEKLNAILSDPGEMERISRLAAELMGNLGGAVPVAVEESASTGGEWPGLLGNLLGSVSGGDKSALLEALAPYLRPERQARLQKALRFARMARLATGAMSEFGGGRGV